MPIDIFSGVLTVALGVSLYRGHRFRVERDRLLAERTLMLSNEGVSAYLEAAQTAGSVVARYLIVAAKKLPDSFRRPMLEGAERAAFNQDLDACSSNSERREVIERWHAKGYAYPQDLRTYFLRSASDKEVRDRWRKMFDEQDVALLTSGESSRHLLASMKADD